MLLHVSKVFHVVQCICSPQSSWLDDATVTSAWRTAGYQSSFLQTSMSKGLIWLSRTHWSMIAASSSGNCAVQPELPHLSCQSSLFALPSFVTCNGGMYV
jgi:hypothetical protein